MSEIVLYTFLKYIIGGTVDRKRWPYFGGTLIIERFHCISQQRIDNLNSKSKIIIHTLIESMNSAALAFSSLLHSLPFHCI